MCRCEDRPCCGCHLEEGDGYIDPQDLDDMADMEPPYRDYGDEEEEEIPVDPTTECGLPLREDSHLDSEYEERFEVQDFEDYGDY